MLDIAPPPLDEVLSELTPMAFILRPAQVVGKLCELRLQESEKRAKGIFLTAVGCGCHQQEVAILLLRQPFEKLVALVSATATHSGLIVTDRKARMFSLAERIGQNALVLYLLLEDVRRFGIERPIFFRFSVEEEKNFLRETLLSSSLVVKRASDQINVANTRFK